MWEVIVGVILSVAATVTTICVFFISRREKSYTDLDTLYLQLLKSAMEHPNFVNPSYTVDYDNMFKDENLWRYKTYAYIVWNICEAIYDRKHDKKLFKTWEPVIVAENKLHRKWFDAPENYHKFKDSFREYIRDNLPQEYKADPNTK
jgi:hypothetical protein